MIKFFEKIPFRIALFLVGALFILLGSSGGGTFNNYDLRIPDIWSRILLSIIGAVLVLVAILLEVKQGSARRSAEDKLPLPYGKKGDILADTNRSLYVGAILYFLAEMTGYQQRREFMQIVRRHASELFETGNPADPPNRSHHYWYKQGRDNFSILIEPHENEGASEVMTHAFLLALALLKRLQMESVGKNADISVTLHPVNDINLSHYGEFTDYWGQSLDIARHLTESSNDHQFIISQEALTHLSGVFGGARQGYCKSLLEHMRGLISSKFESEVRWLEQTLTFNLHQWTLTNQYFHNNQTIHGFTISDSTRVIIGNPIRPPDWVQLEHRDALQPQNPVQRFVKYLTQAEEVCIVGMTHENTAEYLDTALKARGTFWKNIQVVFPSEQTLKEVKEVNRSFDERKKKWEDSKKQLIIFFESQGIRHLDNWSCIECDENFSFWGNRLVIGDQRLIRVAPLIQGADLKNMPYMTFSEGMDGFSLLSEAFDVILASGNSIVEWDLFGKLVNDQFICQGIANHARLDEFAEYWKPVTLVILHTHEIDQEKILLQKRSIFNAVDAYDTYSNISGRLCVSDVASPENVRGFYHEVSKIGKGKKYTTLTPRQESSLATDFFSKITKFKPEVVVAHDAWENAAIREIREELGLTIDKADLRFQAPYNLTGHSLCFRIYSLKISTHQLQEIKERRPHAGLESFGRSQLIDFHKKDRFNRLLQNRFDEVFLPIFDNLEISN